ncbi:MAG TPA: TolC family protein [Bryobacteraceae bacterium]|nr:TolC family protein [Bryobacteraceae bacterium]
MRYTGKLRMAVSILLFLSSFSPAAEITIERPKPVAVVGPLARPFHWERRVVSPANLANTPRLESLVRGGNLYLSLQDVIALVLENNIDIAIQRYGPVLAREVVRRASGGGLLRSVGLPVYPGPASVSLQGVSVNAVGLAETGSGVSSGGGIIVGNLPSPPNLDPYLFAFGSFQHSTTPLSNIVLDLVPSLLNNSRSFQFGYGQTWLTGTSAQLTYGTYRSAVNSPVPILNPYTQGFLDLFIQQPLLQGFGIAVNNRYIRVAKNNLKVTDLQVKRQVITTVSAALNLYWDLVSFNEDLRIKEQALETAQKLYEDNKKQVAIGTLSAIEITRAAAEVSADKENLLIAQTNVAQQETVLKNVLSRNGVASPWLDEVHIVPLDHIQVPETEDLKPNAELVGQALAQRPELEQTRINLQSTLINLAGSKNALLPVLQAFADFTNNALTGAPNALSNGASGIPDPFVVGGYGNLVGQIFRRNYPNYAVGFSLNIPFRNRAAQADYVADQLTLRQAELQLQRGISQVRVEVRNAVIGLQQARVRYETAVATRVLAQQTLDAERKKFQFGTSSIPLVVQAQRDLNNDQSAEVQAMANYTHARIAFDEAVGQTLEQNGISMEEAKTGQVARVASIPEGVLNPKK